MDIKALDAMSAYAKSGKSDAGLSGGDMLGAADRSAFSGLVTDSLAGIGETSAQAEAVGAKALVKDASMIDVVTAVSEAEMMVNTVVSVRDKMIEAYKEIIKMPI